MKLRNIILTAGVIFSSASGVALAKADSVPRLENVATMVKLNFTSRQNIFSSVTNICVGEFVGEDVILTASHCIIDNWINDPNRKLEVQYGKNFASSAALYKGGDVQPWIKFDPQTDLALIRIDKKVANTADAVPGKLVEACGPDPVLEQPITGIEYRRMTDAGTQLPRGQHNTSTTTLARITNSALANGKSYNDDNQSGREGDSGGPVFSGDGTLIGTYNGNAGTRGYISVLCVYADRIRAEAENLGSSIK